MQNQISHRGYVGQISVDIEDNCLYIEAINAEGTYNMAEGRTPLEAKTAFESMIDDYLTDCETEGWEVIQPKVMAPA